MTMGGSFVLVPMFILLKSDHDHWEAGLVIIAGFSPLPNRWRNIVSARGW